MGSSRLPGKVLMPLADVPVIEHVVKRVASAPSLDEVVVATTERAIDDPLAEVATQLGVRVVRGDENDVLSRYGLAAEAARADAVIRVTADCPLIDPDVLGAMIARYRHGRAESPVVELVTNARRRTFPRGLDAELFSRSALDHMLRHAQQGYEREHVTPYLYEHPDRFRIEDVLADGDYSSLRWTLDTADDYKLLQRIFDAALNPISLRLKDVLALLADHPDWSEINAHVEQKTYR